jgi:predicted nucleic acid-binding protein
VSRDFLTTATRERVRIAVPAFAYVEVACALARRLRNARTGRDLASAAVTSLANDVYPMDELIADSAAVGTDGFLRAGDAIYVATTNRADGMLISWDDELLRRGGAVTPDTWLRDFAGRQR